MLEDDIKELWDLGGGTFPWRQFNAASAQRYFDGATFHDHPERWRLSIKTKRLVKENLFEALCSPNEYIREWGRLVMKEQEDARR